MNKEKEKFLNSNTETIPIIIEEELKKLNYASDKVVHYTFLVETALYVWNKHLSQNKEVVYSFDETNKDIIIDLSIKDRKVDPFQIDSEEDISINAMTDRLLSGVGSEIKYFYRLGVNHLVIKLPKVYDDNKIFKRNFFTIMIPIVLQTLFIVISKQIGLIIMGFGDANAMSGIMFANKFYDLFYITFVSGIVVVFVSFISQYWGKRDRETCSNVYSITIIISLLYALIFSILSLVCPEKIMSFYTNIPEFIEQGANYLRCLSVQYFIFPCYYLIFMIMPIMGRQKKSLLYSIIGCLCNIIFNFTFIIKFPQLGSYGVGIASVLSVFVQCLLAIYEVKRYPVFKLEVFNKKILNLDLFKSFLLRVRIPITQCLIFVFGMSIIMSIIGHLEKDLILATSTLCILEEIMFSIGTGACSSTSILEGTCLGKGQLDLAWYRSKIILRIGIVLGIIAVAIFICIVFLMRYLPLSLNETSMSYVYKIFIIIAFNIFFNILNNMICTGMLHLGGDSIGVLIADAVSLWLIMIPLMLLFEHLKWSAFLILLVGKNNETISFLFKYLRYKKKYWLKSVIEK